MAAGASVNGNMVHSRDPDSLPRPQLPGAADKQKPVGLQGDDLPDDSPGEPGANPMDERKSAGQAGGE